MIVQPAGSFSLHFSLFGRLLFLQVSKNLQVRCHGPLEPDDDNGTPVLDAACHKD
jgi:hypothetical protein